MSNTNRFKKELDITDVGACVSKETFIKLETYCIDNFIKRGKLLGDIITDWFNNNIKDSKKSKKWIII